MSTRARQLWLRLLRRAGVKHFRARSGLDLPFVCHLGDLAGEVPFYNRTHSAGELAVMAAWCRTFENPVIVDVGANNGFIATQLAQLLRQRNPRIYAFEPVPTTFAQLNLSIRRLNLRESIFPVCCAVSDANGVARISYNPRESVYAQVRPDTANTRVGSHSALTVTITMDEAVASLGLKPSLVKIDVEGFEVRVLRGATNLLSSDEPPALSFEWNPLTAAELNNSLSEIAQMLAGYHFYYVDDFEGQRRPFGEEVGQLDELSWTCNLFAVSARQASQDRWTVVRTNAAAATAQRM